MNSNHSWSFDPERGSSRQTSQVTPPPMNFNLGSEPQFGSGPSNLPPILQNRFVRFALYAAALMIGGWIFLNVFIGPINRILGMPRVDNLENYSPISSIEVYDKNDQFVTVLQGEEDRQVVKLADVSTSLKQALFASEDRSFYKHGGVNPFNILRAMLINLTSGKVKQGGSTITQQLVKNVFFPPKEWATAKRKIKELFLAIEVEKKYSKDQILEIYLNQIYWGKSAYGVERASKRYFNKKASELNVAESAYLIALLSSPSTLHNTPRVYKIQKQIIKDMVKYGYITQTQSRDAMNYPLKFESAPGNLAKYPYYMSVVLDELRARFSEQELRHMGLKIYTAIDQEAQAKAEDALSQGIKKAPFGISQGALVTIDVPSNEVRVIVGGVGDFWKFQWNRATSVHTIGSAFKPFVYLAAFMKGIYSSDSTIMDTPFVYHNSETGETWAPKNFDSKFWGEITIRKALINSRNIPAVRVAQKSGMDSVQEVAGKVGLTGIEPYLSSALGSSAISPLKAANAYAVLARGGIYMKPVIIRRIVDRSGKVIEQNNSTAERVLPAGPIYELVDILVDVVDHGTGVQAKIPGLQIAGKTGTADGSRDVWFIGFTTDTVTALWGGNDKNQKASSSATGGVVMAAIWKNFMQSYYVLNPAPATFFPKPGQRMRLLVDPITGLLATKDTFQPEYREYVPGTEPKKYAPPPSPEQIEKYLSEMEEQRRSMTSAAAEESDEVSDPAEIEDQLLSNPNDYANQNKPQSPQELPRTQDSLNPPSVKPVLIPRNDDGANQAPVQNQNYNQPQAQSNQPPEDASGKRKSIFKKWRENEEQQEDPNSDPQKPKSRWKRLFSSPY